MERVSVTYRIPKKQKIKLNEHANKYGVSVNSLIVEAIDEYLQTHARSR